jgi:outer membrane murein-binding lipoprotein Lpp
MELMMESLALLVVFVLGYLVSWMQWYQPEYRKVLVQKSLLLLQRDQVAKLESDLKKARSKAQAMELDFARQSEKTQKWAKEKVEGLMSELPQQNLSYWKFEGPKLQARVLELEMQLEQLRSQTLWKD